MKKLMIAAAIAFAAVTSQAVAVKWNWDGTVYDGWKNSGDGYSPAAQSGTMFIYNANAEGVTRQAVLNYLLALDGAAAVTAMDSYTSSNGKMNSMAAKTLAADSTTFAPVRTETEGNYADFFYAMVVTDTDNNKYVYVSQAYDQVISKTAQTTLKAGLGDSSQVNFGEQTTIQTGGGWYTAAVPEPTSGLLLLLGVAGLALRRRRA